MLVAHGVVRWHHRLPFYGSHHQMCLLNGMGWVLGGCITGAALGIICSWMGSALIFPKPCCVMMQAIGGLTDFASSVASPVDAVLVPIELMRLPFIFILGVLKVIVPSDSARLQDTKLIGFSGRSSSSTTIHVDLHFFVSPVCTCCEFTFGVISLLPYGWSWMCGWSWMWEVSSYRVLGFPGLH